MVSKTELDISEELVDEIVEEILAETKPPAEAKKNKTKDELFLDDASDSVKLKSRIQYIENRLEKHVHDYKITTVEVERQIAEKFSEFEQENEKRLVYLQGQLQALREAMIRLSNEIRQSKESISSKKQ